MVPREFKGFFFLVLNNVVESVHYPFSRTNHFFRRRHGRARERRRVNANSVKKRKKNRRKTTNAKHYLGAFDRVETEREKQRSPSTAVRTACVYTSFERRETGVQGLWARASTGARDRPNLSGLIFDSMFTVGDTMIFAFEHQFTYVKPRL